MQKENENQFLKYIVPVVSLVLAVAGIVFAIYVFRYQEKQKEVDLSVDVINVENIFSLKEDVENFDVIYNNQSIKDSKRNIKILDIILNNNGATIYQNYYDEEIPFSLTIENANIVKYEVKNASSDYLKNIVVRIESDSTRSNIVLRKSIWEKETYVFLKLYIFCDNDWTIANLETNGKIAELDSIPVKLVDIETKRFPESKEFFFKIYFICLIAMVTVLVILFALMFFMERGLRKKRIKNVKTFFEKKEKTELNDFLMGFMMYGMEKYHERIIFLLLRGFHVLDMNTCFKQNFSLIAYFYKLILPRRLYVKFFSNLSSETLFFPEQVFVVKDSQIWLNESVKDLLKEYYKM